MDIRALYEHGDIDRNEEYSGPIDIFDQKNVNNGCGMMLSIDRSFFAETEDVKLFYVRDDMWIPSGRDILDVPERIRNMTRDCKVFSSGLAKVRTEVIRYSFPEGTSGDYYAVTFLLDQKQIRKSVRMLQMRWYPVHTEPYILTLTDIMGEYTHAVGWMKGLQNLTLFCEEVDFS